MKNANPVSCLWRAAVWTAVAALTPGCGRGDAPRETAAVKTVDDHFRIEVGGKPVRMQLAVSIREMARGLMERRDLGAEDGMLFVYAGTQRMSFWMRNTPTPLDIGFFTEDGVLREVYPLHPHDETPVQSAREDLKFALEVNQGWFARNGVKPGAKLDLAAVAAALRERGMEPWEYGLR